MKAVIFDMDGVLIDSEPFWKEAEKQVFSSVGVKVTHELSQVTAGMTTAEVTQFWYDHKPWRGKSLEEVEKEVVDLVEQLIMHHGKAMPGVFETLAFSKKENFKVGLATNSPFRLVPVVLERIGITEFFDVTCSSEYEPRGKPHPAVYETTAKRLEVAPAQCIVFEDSTSGIKAAKVAGMKTVAVPPKKDYHHQKYDLADIKLYELGAFGRVHLEYLA